jgi:predicted MPP superfamily phosphohydrolase
VSGVLPFVFPTLALTTLVGVPLYAWRVRGRAYAIFGLVVLAIALPGALFLHPRLVALLPPVFAPLLHGAFAYGMAAGCTHLVGLVQARLRPRPFRWAISIPGMAFIATGALSGLWLLALLPLRAACVLAGWSSALAALAWLDVIPLAVGVLSVLTSLRTVEEIVRIPLDRASHGTMTRLPVERRRVRRAHPAPSSRPLRVVQISDPHLGPWQPVHRLQRRLARLVAQDPDLILLTGDFLTMESAGTPGALARALAPLAPIADRCYAAFGNHDHEAPHEVRHGLAANGIRLLVDDEAIADSPVGPVQILGADWVARGHRDHLLALCDRFPRRPGHLRLLLLHDPLGFVHVPEGAVDLVLSGHTHGGQLGLLSMGVDWTVLSRTRWPDHGLFAHGTNRLYVHRGTGFYGFPLRVGVPGEASVLEILTPPRDTSRGGDGREGEA